MDILSKLSRAASDPGCKPVTVMFTNYLAKADSQVLRDMGEPFRYTFSLSPCGENAATFPKLAEVRIVRTADRIIIILERGLGRSTTESGRSASYGKGYFQNCR